MPASLPPASAFLEEPVSSRHPVIGTGEENGALGTSRHDVARRCGAGHDPGGIGRIRAGNNRQHESELRHPARAHHHRRRQGQGGDRHATGRDRGRSGRHRREAGRHGRRDPRRHAGHHHDRLGTPARRELQHPRHRRRRNLRRRSPHHPHRRWRAEVLRAVPHGLVLLRPRTLQAGRSAARPGLLNAVRHRRLRWRDQFYHQGCIRFHRRRHERRGARQGLIQLERQRHAGLGHPRAAHQRDVRSAGRRQSPPVRSAGSGQRRRPAGFGIRSLVGPPQGHHHARRRPDDPHLLPEVEQRRGRPGLCPDQAPSRTTIRRISA